LHFKKAVAVCGKKNFMKNVALIADRLLTAIVIAKDE